MSLKEKSMLNCTNWNKKIIALVLLHFQGLHFCGLKFNMVVYISCEYLKWKHYMHNFIIKNSIIHIHLQDFQNIQISYNIRWTIFSMLFVLMTSLSLSAVLSCHTCSTSSRLCVLACFRFVCVPISVTSQCLWAMPFHYLWWQSSVVHDHMRAQTPTHTCYLLLTGQIVWRAFKAISALSRSFSSIHTLH